MLIAESLLIVALLVILLDIKEMESQLIEIKDGLHDLAQDFKQTLENDALGERIVLSDE